MGFFEEMEMSQKITTENGALGHATTGKKLLDLNFSTSSLRNVTEDEIVAKFLEAYMENPELAMRWLFFARDIRTGMGERRLFRAVINDCARQGRVITEEKVPVLFALVEKYGRYDDFINLLDLELPDGVSRAIYTCIAEKLGKDILAMKLNKSTSLLAKWLPSINTSSPVTRERAKKIAKAYGISHAEYRKTLAQLRSYIDITEKHMSENDWTNIDYSKVPSQANLRYKEAFLRHDEERRVQFLNKAVSGEVKMNASVLYPCDIVNKYTSFRWDAWVKDYDKSLEALWKNLSNEEISNTLVVADGSGSMACSVGGGRMTALDVANSLAIYFSERNHGEFADKYITFSERPQFVKFDHDASLHDKLAVALEHNEIANTNIKATFDLILKTAVVKHVSQEEMPERILIISDMEFDDATHLWDTFYIGDGREESRSPDAALFEIIEKEYNKAGYKMPRLVFWNTSNRSGAIPVCENELGVALVSGFSTTIADMVMSEELDPYKILVDKLENYKDVDVLLK